MGRKRKLTGEQEQEIWNLYADGKRIGEIAKLLSLPYMLVYTSVRREKNAGTPNRQTSN